LARRGWPGANLEITETNEEGWRMLLEGKKNGEKNGR